MVDYYAELGLDRTLELDDLNWALSKAESVWRSRRTKAPDKAVKMLALIVDARDAFKTEASRAAYDERLAESRRKPAQTDPDETRELEYQRLRQQANDYYQSGMNDLALVTARKALHYFDATRDERDSDLYSMMAALYHDAGEGSQALDYANKALSINPDDAQAHIVRVNVYLGNLTSNVRDTVNASPQRTLVVNAINEALVAAEHADSISAGYIYEFVSSAYYEIGEDAKAKETAYRAIDNLGEGADLANSVLRQLADDERIKSEMETGNASFSEEVNAKSRATTVILIAIAVFLCFQFLAMCSH